VECSQDAGGIRAKAVEGEGMMRFAYALAPLALLLAGACTPTTTATGTGSTEFIAELPEAVRAAAAPFQDLTSVQLRDDGCYWYRHRGPVETTFLPLLTVEGRPICTRLPDAPVTET
jgi:hypothetical protein